MERSELRQIFSTLSVRQKRQIESRSAALERFACQQHEQNFAVRETRTEAARRVSDRLDQPDSRQPRNKDVAKVWDAWIALVEANQYIGATELTEDIAIMLGDGIRLHGIATMLKAVESIPMSGRMEDGYRVDIEWLWHPNALIRGAEEMATWLASEETKGKVRP